MDGTHWFLLFWTALIFYVTGEIWFAQLVVYPLFAKVGDGPGDPKDFKLDWSEAKPADGPQGTDTDTYRPGPDGKLVAFLSDRDGTLDAWVSQIGSGEFHSLTKAAAAELQNPEVRTVGFTPEGSLVTLWTRAGGPGG